LKRIICLMFCLLLAGGVAAANPDVQDAPAISYAELTFVPPLNNVFEAVARSGLRDVSPRVTLSYDELGNVTTASLEKKTGDKVLDRAIVAWALKLKLKPGHAGVGTLPMMMTGG